MKLDKSRLRNDLQVTNISVISVIFSVLTLERSTLVNIGQLHISQLNRCDKFYRFQSIVTSKIAHVIP